MPQDTGNGHHEDHYNALPPGYQMHEYRLDQVLGVGGFGITYLAWDNNLNMRVAIKEYLPTEFAVRAGDVSVRPKSNADGEDYRWGLERFMEEAQMLARFRNKSIVQVFRYFEAHGTAYMVMAYEQGESFAEVIKRDGGRFVEDDLLQVVLPLLDGLEEVHAAKVLHRDIKPSNIYIRADGSPVLLDFGAARDQISRKSRGLTSIVTPGYAPNEQYYTEGDQGPWTDIYAMGAILYQAVSGKLPPEAPARVRQDSCSPAIEVATGRYSQAFLNAIDWALAVNEWDRPQTVADWRAALLGEAPVPAPRAVEGATVLTGPEAARRPGVPPEAEEKKGSSVGKWAAAAVVLLAIGAGAWYAAPKLLEVVMPPATSGRDTAERPTAATERPTMRETTPPSSEQPKTAQPTDGSQNPGSTAPPKTATEQRPPKPPATKTPKPADPASQPRVVQPVEPAKTEPAPKKPTESAALPPATQPAPKAPAPKPKKPKVVTPQKPPPAKPKPPVKKAKLVTCPWLLPALKARLPVKDCAAVSGVLNSVLEEQPTGKRGSWRSRDGSYSGSVMPVQTYVRPNGIPCRRFTQTVTLQGKTRRAEGTACRDRIKPEWKIQL